MDIRVATLEDAAAILDLVPRLSCSGAPPWRDMAEMIAADARAVLGTLEQGTADSQVLVAERAGTVLGFIHLMTETDYYTGQSVGHIADLAVAAEAEGLGIGRAMMAAAEDWARHHGYSAMTLNVLVHNARARGLYEKLGYGAEWVKYLKPLR